MISVAYNFPGRFAQPWTWITLLSIKCGHRKPLWESHDIFSSKQR